MSSFFGFRVGDRVSSGKNSKGTVVDPKYDPSDAVDEFRLVPVVWDKHKEEEVISWTMSENLWKISN